MSSSGRHSNGVSRTLSLGHALLCASFLIFPGIIGGETSERPTVRPAAPAAEDTRLVTAVAARPSVADSTHRPTLRPGSRGRWVRVVQRKLDVAVDGAYGPVTEDAVIRFQRRRGLMVDGVVGPQTWQALDRVHGSGGGRTNGNGGKSSGDGRSPVGGGKASGGAAAAVSYARAQVGDSYVYGAEGPDAFDCSGLTMMAWRQAGVRLPHSSRAQAGHGTPVSWSQLRPGDLIFTYKPISHVGIYVGDGKMVAASNPEDGVELIELDDGYWRRHFTAARRM